MHLNNLRQILLKNIVAVSQKERFMNLIANKRQTAARPHRLVFPEEKQFIAPIIVLVQISLNRICHIIQGNKEPSTTYLDESIHDGLNDSLFPNRQKRLGKNVGERSKSRPFAPGHHNHRHIIALCRVVSTHFLAKCILPEHHINDSAFSATPRLCVKFHSSTHTLTHSTTFHNRHILCSASKHFRLYLFFTVCRCAKHYIIAQMCGDTIFRTCTAHNCPLNGTDRNKADKVVILKNHEQFMPDTIHLLHRLEHRRIFENTKFAKFFFHRLLSHAKFAMFAKWRQREFTTLTIPSFKDDIPKLITYPSFKSANLI